MPASGSWLLALRPPVTRRVVALIVVSAALAALSTLALTDSLRDAHPDRAQDGLLDAVRVYGSGVLDRLAAADELLDRRSEISRDDFESRAAASFSSVVAFDSSYQASTLLGRIDAAALTRIAAAVRGAAGSGAQLTFVELDTRPTAVLIRRVRGDSTIAAALHPSYLWGEGAQRPAGGRAVAGAAPGLDGAVRTVPLALTLAVAIGLLLGLVHVALGRQAAAALAAATRRFAAGDFSVRIGPAVDREYGDLSHAVNRTAATAERQARLLAVLGEMDQRILGSDSLDSILELVLTDLRRATELDAAVVLPAATDEDGAADLFVLASDGALTQQRRAVSRRELSALLGRARADTPLHLDWRRGRPPVEALSGRCTSLVALPVRDDSDPIGLLLLLGRHAEPAPQQIEVGRCLAARLSLATGKARRKWDLLRQAYFDPVTELPNRVLLRDRLQQALTRPGNRPAGPALLHVGLDRFKGINDSLGHAAGDQVLRLVADRIRAMVPDADTIARLEGDEFAVLLTVAEPTQARAAAESIGHCFKRPFRASGVDYFLSVSTGIASACAGGATADQLLNNARTAMRRAKRQAAGSLVFFEEAMTAQAARRAYLEHELRAALQDQQLEVHFQPQLDLRRGVVIGAEALLRWNRPSEGTVECEQFIPIAEETGLIVPIGYWVMERACRSLLEWRRSGLDIRNVAVNLSLRQLRDPEFVPSVARILSATGLPRGSLELEITESTLAERPAELAHVLQQLRDHGVRIAIDDFGTGYSSLAMLQQLPIDVLKIDRAFIRDIAPGGHAEAITSAIIAMGRALGKELVAEGIETVQQALLLESRGCTIGQGFRYSEALPSSEFVEFCLQGANIRGGQRRAEGV